MRLIIIQDALHGGGKGEPPHRRLRRSSCATG
jgi:hypothetical protein